MGLFSSKKTEKAVVAYWTQKTHLFRSDEYICSNCDASFSKPAKICPRCGAVMKKSKYDANWVDEAEMMDMLF